VVNDVTIFAVVKRANHLLVEQPREEQYFLLVVLCFFLAVVFAQFSLPVIMSSSDRPGFITAKDATVLVTGSTGLCGARLVEMVLERGAKHVICFDIAAPDSMLRARFDKVCKNTGGRITVRAGGDGDLTSADAVDKAFACATDKVDVVYHIGALVGPFFERSKYMGVNYHGTLSIIEACRKYKVPRLVYSSSPSTRFTGADITGQREEELPIPNRWLAMYAEAKAYGEMEVSKAHGIGLFTVSVAPHQVYGPHDSLFLPNILEVAGNGRLRIFGRGQNMASVTYVDNYAHGCMCGADALTGPEAACGGKFYVVTDGPPVNFWDFLNQAVVACGFQDLHTRFHLPAWFLYTLAYICNGVSALTGKKFKLNPFNVTMLIIHRYFSIENAQRDLQYQPVVTTEVAWPATIEWFQRNWLPGFIERRQRSRPSFVSKEL
jgi:nucleoside-diphosphate-sugar epimerase